MTIQVQQSAPDFKAEAVLNGDFQEVSLANFKGKWTVLFFYPLDFTFVCPTEIIAFNDKVEDFRKLNAEVVGVSVDSKFTHLAWLNTPRSEGGLGQLDFPLVSDLNKSISRDYGVLLEGAGIALRGVFIIDPEGKVAYQLVHDLGIGRNVDEIVRVLQALQTVRETGEVCPANWTSGSDTMAPDPNGSKTYFSKHNS
jgi:peroxiredoxin (alkyl hydroperoxide reductase subunit C)